MLNRRKKLEEMSPLARARHDIQGRIVSGLLVLVPLGITVFILDFLLSLTVGMVRPAILLFVEEPPKTGSWLDFTLNVLSLLVLILILYVVGLVAANIVGRRLIGLGESILARIPLVKTIYSASKQVVDAFSIKDKTAGMRAVALVEFPSEGLRSIGFVTGTMLDEKGRECCRVFIPTTPNPTTGYFLIIPREKVYYTQYSMEEACKMLMSGGIVAPDRIEPCDQSCQIAVEQKVVEEDAAV